MQLQILAITADVSVRTYFIYFQKNYFTNGENTFMSIGLILIDIQNDYFPSGKMELDNSEQAGKVVAQILIFFRNEKLPIFHIQHISTRPNATFFLPNTLGVQIHEGVQPINGEMKIIKHYPNSSRETELLPQLKKQNIQQLVIIGMMTHMCVDATTRAATDYGYECLIAHDACATRSLKFGNREVSAVDVHTAFLAALNGSYGKVMASEDIMKELRKYK
jgi:nicotinamidase-related amidase